MISDLGFLFSEGILAVAIQRYSDGMREWIGNSLDFSDKIEQLQWVRTEGKVLLVMLLWSYGRFSVSDISIALGVSESAVRVRLLKGDDLLRSSQRFKSLYDGYRLRHIEQMQELFNLEFEDNYSIDEIRFLRATDEYIYLELEGGIKIRLGLNQAMGLGHLSRMIAGTKKGVKLRKLNLIEE
jgi:hypothetical protein